jgi:hypothetical protein
MRVLIPSNRRFALGKHRTLHILLIAASIALCALLVAFNIAHCRRVIGTAPDHAAHILIAVDAAAVLIVACSLHLLLARKRGPR